MREMKRSDFTYKQLLLVPFEMLEAAWKARRRTGVLEKGIARDREKIAKAELRIKKANQDIDALKAEIAKADP